ncbi:MAG: hypothetical protein E7A79_03220 [Actinomycetaceae bacterium]|nr:hypothetical protein [Actinomycetaceae bacterium]
MRQVTVAAGVGIMRPTADPRGGGHNGGGIALSVTGEPTSVDTDALSVFGSRLADVAAALEAVEDVCARLADALVDAACRVHDQATREQAAGAIDPGSLVRAAQLSDAEAGLRRAAAAVEAQSGQLQRPVGQTMRLSRSAEQASAVYVDHEARAERVWMGVGALDGAATPQRLLGRIGRALVGFAVTMGVLPSGNVPGNDRVMEDGVDALSQLLLPVGFALPTWGDATVPGKKLSAAQRAIRLGVGLADAVSGTRGHHVAVGAPQLGPGPLATLARHLDALAGRNVGAPKGATAACPLVAPHKSRQQAPPITGGQLVHALDEPANGTHALRILKHETAGKTSWTVVVPGTEEWSMGEANAFDMDTNLRVSGALPTAQEAAVAEAMKQMQIPANEPVEFVGHSQGAMVVSRLVSDPLLTRRYNVTSALAVGGATAGVTPRGNVKMLAVENTNDIVPQLDGVSRPQPTRGLVTVKGRVDDDTAHAIEPGRLPGTAFQHGRPVYAAIVDEAQRSGDPDVAAWTRNRQATIGLDSTTRTEVYDFAVTRVD